MGDFIVSLPAMECLRTGYLEVWCAAPNVPLAEHFACQARSISSTGLDLLELGAADARLLNRLREFDSIISWYGANRPEFRSAVAEMGLPFQFFTALPADGYGRHAVEFYLDQVRSIAGHGSPSRPLIELGITRGNFAVIHPFAGSAKKRWPLDRFQALATRLASYHPVEWCAGPEDKLAGARRFADLMDLARWLASARIYIGNDSGPTHLAAAVQTDVVALFGPTDPMIWAPRGERVTVVAAPPDARAMEAISIEQVTEAVRDMLALRVL